MSTGIRALSSADFIRLPFVALKPVCAVLGARLYVSTNHQHALEGLFDSPVGFTVVLVPGNEIPLTDSSAGEQIDELQIWSVGISILVSHRLPPTSVPTQALYEKVGSMPPFLDLVSKIRDAIREMQMPRGSTDVFWTYKGRRYMAVADDSSAVPVYQLDFEITATPPYPDGSPEICRPLGAGADEETDDQSQEEGE